ATFDYRHGNTCHPAHRAAGYIVTQAASRIRFPTSSIFVSENYPVSGSNWIGFATVVASDSNVSVYDVSANWSAFATDLSFNASQFTSAQVAAAANTPAPNRIMSVMTANKLNPNDPRYASLCPEPASVVARNAPAELFAAEAAEMSQLEAQPPMSEFPGWELG